MLSVLGSLASLIGLSIQVYEKFVQKNPTVIGQYMGLLIIITDTAQCWKIIHHKYQNLSNDLDAVRRNLLIYDGLNIRAKAPSDIAPNKIRNIFESGIMQDAVHYFKDDLAVAFEPLRVASNLADDEKASFREDIKNTGRNDLIMYINNVVQVQAQTVKIHDEFCDFLQYIESMLNDEQWNEEQIRYLLKKRALITTRFDKTIKNADSALISFMSVMKIIVDEVRAREGG